MEVTVIIPSYNEDVNNIISKCHYFSSKDFVKRIYVVDDGSLQPLPQIHINKVQVTRCYKNVGKANAINTVKNQVDTSLIFLQDADNEYPVENIESMYREMIASGFDMIITKRFVPIDEITFSGVIANRLIYKILGLPDAFSGQRMVQTERFLQCKISGGFELETQLNLHAISNNWKVGYIDSLYYPRSYKNGKKIKYYHFLPILKEILFDKVKNKMSYIKKKYLVQDSSSSLCEDDL